MQSSFLHMISLLPPASDRPPCLFIHGAANSASVWQFWQRALSARGWPTHALDLRGHGRSAPLDLSATSMDDYVEDVCAAAARLNQPPVLVGWSMGGMVAMMAASRVKAIACIGLAPSMPERHADPSAPLREGTFTAEAYGITSRRPEEQTVMQDLDFEERTLALDSLCAESLWARDERKRGIVIASLPCPLLIATGAEDTFWPREVYDDLCLAADFIEIEGASHWGLVLNRRKLAEWIPAIEAWLLSAIGPGAVPCPPSG